MLAAVSFGLLMPMLPMTTAAESDDVFGGFTNHIARQIVSDKHGFMDAQTCTKWFYRHHDRQPARPPVQGIAYRAAVDDASEVCPKRYPGGLDAARDAFGRTQSTLSISLTFYELALVGDRNDDQRYSGRELQDLLEACGLPYNGFSGSQNLAALTGHFDTLHRSGSLDRLMTGMSALFDKGYRLSQHDRAALDKISG
jgi:hypothetical protein